MKKILVTLLLGLFLINIVSAGFTLNFEKDIERQLEKQGTTNYGNYEITEHKWWDILKIWTEKKVEEIELLDNTDVCGSECFAIKNISLYEKGRLIDDIKFETIKEGGKRIEQPIKDYHFYLKTQVEDILVDDYENQCEKKYNPINKTYYKLCKDVKVGSHYEESFEWIEFDIKQEFEVGNYEVKLIGNKKPSITTDWIIKSRGKWLDSWALWGGQTFQLLTNYSIGYDSNAPVLEGASWGGETFKLTGDFLNYEITNISIYTYKDGTPPSLEVCIYDTVDDWQPNTELACGNITAAEIDDTPQDWYNASVSYTLTNNTYYSIILRTIGGDGSNRYICGSDASSPSFTNGFAVSSGDSGGTWSNNTGVDMLFEVWGIPTSGTVTVNSPADYFNSSLSEVEFNCSAEVTGVTLTNISLWHNGTGTWELNQTQVVTGTSNESIFNTTFSDGEYSWTCEACDSDSDCGFASENRTTSVDNTSPNITMIYPIGLIDYGALNNPQATNWTISDTNLESCWYEYNGTNQSVTCYDNYTTFNLEEYYYNLTFYTNDTHGNIASEFIEWEYKVFENSRTYNLTSYETAYESYQINVTANESLTDVSFIYNGSSLGSMTNQGSGIWTYARDLPTTILGNNSVNFRFTYSGDTLNSDYLTYQQVDETNFSLCSATLKSNFLNLTFKDEADSTYINATIPTSTFEYYLGSGSVIKTFQLINNTENPSYAFCTNVNRTFHTDSYVQYASTGYPQRIWNPSLTDYTNATTNQILYLASSSDVVPENIQVLTVADQPVSGALVIVSRYIGSELTVISTGTTGDNGVITMYLNPDFLHYANVSKSGFTGGTVSFFPTGDGVTIILGGGISVPSSCMKGINYHITPNITELINDTSYSFGFLLTSSFWELEEYGFSLRLSNGTSISGGNTAISGTQLSLNYNVNNQTVIYVDYYWEIAGDECSVNSTQRWIIYNTANTQWSIGNFVSDLKSYMDSGLFGLDDFGRYIFIFIIMFIVIGTMSYKYGLTSQMSIFVMTFLIIFTFDVVFGLIPVLKVGSGKEVPYLLTFLSGIIMMIIIIKEVSSR